ncbi:MAG: hypothetical protein WAN61_02505 [Minisyncoccia bacterium]
MEPENKIQNNAVQTYAEDVARIIENEKGDMVKKIIHGEEKHEEETEKKNLSPELKKNKFFLALGIFLTILAFGLLAFFFFFKKNNVVPVASQFTPIIFNDQTVYLEVSGLNKDEIAQTVANEVVATKVKIGGLEGIYLTVSQKIIGLRQFLALIKSHYAPDNNTALLSDNFLMGVVKNSVSPAPAGTGTGFFILLKVSSIADVFDPLRTWENNMLADLHGFLGVNISSGTDYLFKKDFTDGIVQNKNARILYDNNGNIVLMYIFADDNSVIITDSPSATNEVMLRLASSQEKQ